MTDREDSWPGWEDDLEQMKIPREYRDTFRRLKTAIIELRTAMETVWRDLDELWDDKLGKPWK